MSTDLMVAEPPAPSLVPAVSPDDGAVLRGGALLRDYQSEGIERIRTLYDEGTTDLLCVMATGAGKTVTLASIIHAFPELARHGTLILVHRDELVWQTVEKIRMVDPTLRVGVEKAEHYAGPADEVVVASVQTVGRKGSRRFSRLMAARPFGLVMVDEAHHARPGSQYDNVLTALGLGSHRHPGEDALPCGLRRLHTGWTATPNRNDRVGLSHFYSEIAFNYDIRFLVREGYLCEPVRWVCRTNTSLEGVSTSAGDFTIGQLSERVNVKERNDLIVASYLKHCTKPDGSLMSFVAFAVDREHAHALAETFNAAGIPSRAADYLTPADERREILRQHASGEIKGLINNLLFTEGFDGIVEAVLMCRPTKSQSLFVQCIGRGLRTIPSDLGNLPTREQRLEAIASGVKPVATIIEFSDGGPDVVTIPSLFGLPPKFEAQGKRIFKEVVEVIEAAKEKSPLSAMAISMAQSLDEVEVLSRRVDAWSVALSSAGLPSSKMRWLSLGEDVWQLDVPRSEDGEHGAFAVRVEADLLGHATITAIWPRRYDAEMRTSVPERRVKAGEAFASIEEAVAAAEARVRQVRPDAERALLRTASWRQDRPSPGQMGFLRKLNVPTDKVTTKGMASDLITAALALKAKEKESAYGEEVA